MRYRVGACVLAVALVAFAAAAQASAPNGRIGYLRPLGGNEPPYGHLFAVNPDGSGAVDLTPAGYTDIRSFAWSPSGRTGLSQVYRMRADGGGQRRLTNALGNCDSPAWSPRGTLIAFHCALANEKVSVMRPDGTHIRTLLRRSSTIDGSPSWSPDGRVIAFSRGLRGPSWRGLGIWTVRTDGRGLRRITAAGGDPTFSPDARWLAFVRLRNGNQELYKVRTNGRGLSQLTKTYGITEAAPAWQRGR
jgi:Tol biopolymer transport system component